ncbi:MAG TPA: ribonuclease catalytic domain-containing protein [Burkholderiales bacterium]|nr:ribonuclease catalytic domain-containing protein [Burkholderiales bacterium]
MNVFYEEDGTFKVGTILADNDNTLQVEAAFGKRGKIKSSWLLFRFEDPEKIQFMERAQQVATSIDPDFLWSCCGEGEFCYEALAREYFGHQPSPVEAAGLLIRLHGSPMYFYKKGRGRYKAAPPEALKAALASIEKKRVQAAQQANYVEQLIQFNLPREFAAQLTRLLYKPDRSGIEFKALEVAAAATHLTVAHLLEKCGAIPSTHDYHVERFLFEHFPEGIEFGDFGEMTEPQGLPLAEAEAFSIDDVTTSEIDDAFSVSQVADKHWRIGVHIAAPALGFATDSRLDSIAARRLSTVYMPGRKITMLPESVIGKFTLTERTNRPAVSMYLEVCGSDLTIVASSTRIERVPIGANLQRGALEKIFNESTLSTGKLDFPLGSELKLLWQFAETLEKSRARAEAVGMPQLDYNFYIENGHVTITERRRGTPVDKIVSELMIYVNTAWGKLLADNQIAAIFRAQGNGKVKMSTAPGEHQGLGVGQYIWASSPLRRYVDLVNQRQLLAWINGDIPPYARNSGRLLIAMRDFELAYEAYALFQRTMERYWCLRWLQQESASLLPATVVRDNLVKIEKLPLYARITSMPELPAASRVEVEISQLDFLELSFACRHKRSLDTQ